MEHTIQNVRSWVDGHQEELLAVLGRLVSVPSVAKKDGAIGAPFGPACRCALDEMLDVAGSMGFDTDDHQGFAGSARLNAGIGGAPGLGIWCHLDVVPAGDGWYHDPYALTVQDGFLIGRGVQDNKGPLAGMLLALGYLKAHGLPRHRTMTLYGGCNEENGMDDIDALLAFHTVPQENLVADCGFPLCHGEMGNLRLSFVAELPQDGNLLSLQAGSSVNSIPARAEAVVRPLPGVEERLRGLDQELVSVTAVPEGWQVVATGRAGHVGFPEGSESALYKLTRALEAAGLPAPGREAQAIRFLNAVNADFYGTGANIACEDALSGRLRGHLTMASLQNGHMVLEADYRYPITLKEPQALVERCTQLAESMGLRCTLARHSPPCYIPPDSALVTTLMNTYRDITGSCRPPYTMSGGTYARKLPGAVAYGMSMEHKSVYRPDGNTAAGDCHQPDESLNLEEYLQAITIYILSLIRLDEAAAPD